MALLVGVAIRKHRRHPDPDDTRVPDDTPAPDTSQSGDDGPDAPDDELPDTFEELLTELELQFRLSQEALAADPPRRSAWAAAQDRIDELLEQFRSLAEDPPSDSDAT